MAQSISELRSIVSDRESQIQSLLYMHQRAPDATYRTGRIKGEDSRYTLKVWYRPNGYGEALLIHHHPGQSDSAHGPYRLDTMGSMYRADTAEGWALSDMVQQARSAHSRYVLSPV